MMPHGIYLLWKLKSFRNLELLDLHLSCLPGSRLQRAPWVNPHCWEPHYLALALTWSETQANASQIYVPLFQVFGVRGEALHCDQATVARLYALVGFRQTLPHLYRYIHLYGPMWTYVPPKSLANTHWKTWY